MDLSALLCLLKPCTDDASNAKNAPVLAFTSDCDVEHENVQASRELSTACTCSLHPKCAFPGCAVLKVSWTMKWGHEVKMAIERIRLVKCWPGRSWLQVS